MHSGEQIFLLPAEDLPPTSLPEFPFTAGSGALAEQVRMGDCSPLPWLGIHKSESQGAVSGLSGWPPEGGRDNREQALGPFSFLKRSSFPR